MRINGQPGALFVDADRRLLNVVVLDILDGTIQAVRSVVNPDKLHHLGPLISADHPLRGGGTRRPNRRLTRSGRPHGHRRCRRDLTAQTRCTHHAEVVPACPGERLGKAGRGRLGVD